MAAKKTGLLVHFDEDQRKDFIREIADGGYEPFTDALSIHDWEIGQLSIALLCFSESTIDYIAIAKKGKRVVTSKSRIEFSSMINLSAISIAGVEARLSEKIKRFFIKASRGIGGAIPDATWLGLIDDIKLQRPNLVGEIQRLLSLRRYAGFHLSGDTAEIFLQEREALGISLDIFAGNNKLRDRVLAEWAPSEDTVSELDEKNSTASLSTPIAGHSSFLKGISHRYIQEESAIQHDLLNWPGMSSSHVAGITVFEQGNRRLEVIYANRNKLENTLGVDLIYYNEEYELFVLVQYKLMRKEGESTVYRPDKQLKIELERMDRFHGSNRLNAPIESHEQYRLNADGFMLKLVPNSGLKPSSGELIKGMYIPREYMHFLCGDQGGKGPKGGSQITFENAPRYFTNSQFAASIHAGWIGTRGIQTVGIRSMIKEYYETERSLMVAYEYSTKKCDEKGK